MATTFLVQMAQTILENENQEWDIKINTQYKRSMDATEKARQNPKDFGLGVASILEQDRLSHLSMMRDVDMERQVQETRVYLNNM